MDWIGLAQHWERWQDLVDVVMNIRFSSISGNLMTEDPLASQEGLYSMELVIGQLHVPVGLS
jgi:hypothetical protein